jgi:predicted flap endonuclease-1-like 5' DNA nuclease
MNHICRASAAPECNDPNAMGWSSKNLGIVREIFKELNRWNQTPYAQQIRCGLLYRWSGDVWAIEDRPGVQEDFQQALEKDYRWRITPAADVAFSFGAPGAEEEEPQALEERRIVKPDNLKRIRGIGRKTETVLNALGIQIFEQLAQYTPKELETLISETGLRSRHLETWPKQARLIAEGGENER